VAALLANPARSAMVNGLLDGPPLTAGELARLGRVSPGTASEHLAALVASGLLRAERRGRQRYFRLADRAVADALEALARICPPTQVRSLRASADAHRLRFARTCYDHLAGQLGVSLLEGMLQRGWLIQEAGGFRLAPDGKHQLARLKVDLPGAFRARRGFALACLDWTERRPHLAGALGKAVADLLFEQGWLARRPGSRGVDVTAAGKRQFGQVLRLDVDALRAASS
jgi:DNA-binding transcriptional ArsR family regulator